MRETIGSGSTAKVLDFIYDESGKPFALKYSTNGGRSFKTYYYVLNLQGDVVKLVEILADDTGVWSYGEIANYEYDAWGKILSVTDERGNAITDSTHLAHLNPLRYRGYYYDSETGFYYLQSRYYDPVVKRFINADSFVSTGQGFNGTNMFAYCNNNPIMFIDPTGNFAIFDELREMFEEAKQKVNDDFTPINGQDFCKYADMRFGLLKFKENGCAVVAIYNALGLTNRASYIPNIADYFTKKGSIRLFGVMPYEIGDYFSDHNIPYQRATSVDKLNTLMTDGGVAVITSWNASIARYDCILGKGAVKVYSYPDYFAGAHTIAITHDGKGSYCAYNRYSNRTDLYMYSSIEECIGNGVYISGYYIGQ